jgi:hypothetical protein
MSTFNYHGSKNILREHIAKISSLTREELIISRIALGHSPLKKGKLRSGKGVK